MTVFGIDMPVWVFIVVVPLAFASGVLAGKIFEWFVVKRKMERRRLEEAERIVMGTDSEYTAAKIRDDVLMNLDQVQIHKDVWR